MDPELLLEAVYTALYRDPPAGLDPGDVAGFFGRNRLALIEAVRRAFPVGRIEPAFARLREEHRLARLALGLVRAYLHTGGPPARGRDLGDLVEALDDHVIYEERVLFPYLRGHLPSLAPALEHARAEHADLSEHLFALASALRAGRRYDGPALDAALHHFDEEEAQIVAPALAAGLARTPAGDPGRLSAFAADIERLAAEGEAPDAGEPTHWGGRRGRELARAEVQRGQRVVTDKGEHGVVADLHRISLSSVVNGRRVEEMILSFRLRLDSGRELTASGPLYAERAPPTSVVEDVAVGGLTLAPSDVWARVLARHRDIARFAERAAAARKGDRQAQWQRQSEAARGERDDLFGALAAWRARYPDEPVPGLYAPTWRQLALETRADLTEDERWELAWLRRLPADWATRFQVGDAVVLHVLGPYGRQPEPGWTVQGLDGDRATVARGEERRTAPVWMLQADVRAAEAEVFTEPRYLRELASEMLVQTGEARPYPKRGAVARAVKSFLAEHGIAVSTLVRQGSMVTGIDLSAPKGRWDEQTVARMRALLPGLNVSSGRQASFEPWETTGAAFDPYADYQGKGAGLLISAAHVGRFAAILAAAMKADGQALNALGERRLAAATAGGRAVGGSLAGATAEQRAEGAQGCRELEFDLPGHGRIRVVCGQEGRRDVWFNVYVATVRYGFNGGRWARGQRPPEAVLAAIRERGVGVFG